MLPKRAWLRLVLLLVPLVAALFAARGLYSAWVQRQVASYFRDCQSAQRDGRWTDLQRLSERWSLRHPDSADAWLFRADAAQRLGDFSSAATYLASFPESDPKTLSALVALSKLQFGPLNRPLDGERTCERILELEPRAIDAHRQLIEFSALTLQRQKLIDRVYAAISASRESPAAYVYLFLIDTMRMGGGVETNSRWLEADPESELFLVARALQMPEPGLGNPGAADDKYALVDTLLKRFPTNLELLAYKVDLGIRAGSVADVASFLQRAPAAADIDARFWRAKGWLHLSRNELVKAREALDMALELNPLDRDARTWLSDVSRREGNLPEAERLDRIVQEARKIRLELTDLESADAVTSETLAELAAYADRCGDRRIADALFRRTGRR